MNLLKRLLGIGLGLGIWLLAIPALSAERVPSDRQSLQFISGLEAPASEPRLWGLAAIAMGALLATYKLAEQNRRLKQKLAACERDILNLRESRECYRQALIDAPFPTIVHAEDGEILELSTAWTELSGYTRADIPTIGDWARLAYGDRAPGVLETSIAQKYALESCWDEGEFAIETRDGQQRLWEFRTAPLEKLSDGRRAVISMAADVTQRRQAERNLSEREARYRSLFNQTAVGIVFASIEGRLLDVNQRFCDLIGYSCAELQAKRIVDITHPEDRARLRPDIERLLAGETDRFSQEKRYIQKDGSYLWADASVSLVRDEAGNPQYTLAVIRDVTQYRQASAKLQQSQQLLRTILDTLPLSIFWKDRECVYLGCNQNFARKAGVPDPVKILGKTDFDLPWTEAEATAYRTDDRQVMDSGTDKLGIIETQVQADGKQAWLETHKVPLRDAAGRVVGVIGAYQDVTAREQAQITIAQQLAAIEAAAEGIGILRDGVYISLNRSHTALFGYERPEDLIGQSWQQLYPPEEVARFERDILPALARDRTWQGEMIARRRDGSTFIEGLSLTLADNGILIRVSRDISNHKASEAALRASEARWQFALEGSGDGVWDWNVETNRVFFSHRWKAMLGYADADLDDDFAEWDRRVHPEDRQRCYTELERCFSGQIATYHCEHRLRCKDGTYRWILGRGKIIERGADNKASRMIGTHTDISARKRADLALQNLLAGTVTTGKDFFPALVAQIAEALQATHAIVSQRIGDELHTLALWANGNLVEDFSYPFAKTPCERVIREGVLFCKGSLQQEFPEARDLLSQLGADSYLGVALRDSRGQPLGVLCTINPHLISDPEQTEKIVRLFATRASAELERVNTEDALRNSEERYRLLAENANDLVCLHAPDGHYLFVSPSCESLLGYHYREMLGCDPYEFIHPDDRERVRYEAHQPTLAGKSTPITYRMRAKSGAYVWFETLTNPIYDDRGQVERLQTTSRDVSERVKVQERLFHEARHDTLTGLPNRTLLVERLETCLQLLQCNPQNRFALLFLDLDRFKVINDSLGHASGDRVLVAIAHKLQKLVGDTAIAARLGGDEFVVLLPNITAAASVTEMAVRISQALQAPIELGDREVVIGASIGIVFGNIRYTCGDDILRDADLAMYRAKQGSGIERGYKIAAFNTDMHTRALQRLQLEGDLRSALQQQEFFVEYQPIIELGTGKVARLEALVRWQHPVRGRVTPEEFIPVAEETGAIVPIDRWVLQTACQQLAAWRARYPQAASWRIGINFCARDLQAPDLLEHIDTLLASLQLSGHCLTVEITERLLVANFDRTIELLERLRARNISLSIDDFGTGYSSLAYLHQLPVDSLKIDRTFVSQMERDRRSYEIAETIVTLSNRLGIEAIAEGVETPQQQEILTQLGCEFGQGYQLAKPMPAEALEAWLRASGSIAEIDVPEAGPSSLAKMQQMQQ